MSALNTFYDDEAPEKTKKCHASKLDGVNLKPANLLIISQTLPSNIKDCFPSENPSLVVFVNENKPKNEFICFNKKNFDM